MRALHDYGDTGGMDFSAIDAQAFRRNGMIELPLTSVYTGLLREGGSSLYARAGRWPRGRGALARLGLLNRIPLTPEGVGIGDALVGIDRALADGCRLLTFRFTRRRSSRGIRPMSARRATGRCSIAGGTACSTDWRATA
ncbi:hypothetical protein P0F65_05655 [Sphingomonas sp. I4]